jgi:hypothetical protein
LVPGIKVGCDGGEELVGMFVYIFVVVDVVRKKVFKPK